MSSSTSKAGLRADRPDRIYGLRFTEQCCPDPRGSERGSSQCYPADNRRPCTAGRRAAGLALHAGTAPGRPARHARALSRPAVPCPTCQLAKRFVPGARAFACPGAFSLLGPPRARRGALPFLYHPPAFHGVAVIVCPARSIEGMHVPALWRRPLAEGRLLVLSPFAKKDRRVSAVTVPTRNPFVASLAGQILVAHAHAGKCPQRESGPITDASGETWMGIEAALHNGPRGLPGGSSLARLLASRRKVRNKSHLRPLKPKSILAWADRHHQRTADPFFRKLAGLQCFRSRPTWGD